MKPLQIGLLMAAAAVGGAILMKWESRGTKPAAEPAVATTVAPVPVAPPEPLPAVAPEKPSPMPEAPKYKPREYQPRAGKAAAAAPEKPRIAANQPPAQVHVQPLAPAPAAPESTPAPAPAPPVKAEPAPPPPPPPPAKVTLAAGTSIAVRTVETISSERNSPGDTFSATLAQPLVVDGFVIAERGARAEGRVVQSDKGGRVKGGADLAIELTRITTADGQHVAISTESFQKVGATRTKEEAAKVGGGAALGAIIGAIAGGGKGAGIGAGVGGAAGAGDVLLTHGKPVTLPSETLVTFRLRAPVTITERK